MTSAFLCSDFRGLQACSPFLLSIGLQLRGGAGGERYAKQEGETFDRAGYFKSCVCNPPTVTRRSSLTHLVGIATGVSLFPTSRRVYAHIVLTFIATEGPHEYISPFALCYSDVWGALE